MKSSVFKRMLTINKSKKPTGNSLLNGIPIKTLTMLNKQNKSSDKFLKPMRFSPIKIKENTMTSTVTKRQSLSKAQPLKDIDLTSTMLKIFLDTSLNKIPLMMTSFLGSSEDRKEKRILLLKWGAGDLVHLMMIHSFQVALDLVG